MLKILHSLFFSEKRTQSQQQQLKVLLVHQNLNLTKQQTQALLNHVHDAVNIFVHEELNQTPPRLSIVEERKKKA